MVARSTKSKKREAISMRGTITMRGSVADAVEYAARLGCDVESARLSKEPSPPRLRPLQLLRPKEERVVQLDVGASSAALNKMAYAQCSRFLTFTPTPKTGANS